MSVSAEQQLLDPPLEQESDPKRFYGVTTGRVINLLDPMMLGRVQVQLPFIDCLDLNPFARIAVPMAGPFCGVAFLPQVGDEVLVAFEQGDVNVPYIIGSLWNALAPPLPPPPPEVRINYSIRTVTGNQIVMSETPPTLTLQNGPTPPVLPPVPAPGPSQTLQLTPTGKGCQTSEDTANGACARSSRPAEVFHRETCVPNLRHVDDFLTFELHHVDVVGAGASAGGWDRASWTGMGGMKNAVCRDIIPNRISCERLQIIARIWQDGHYALHPVRVLRQGL